MLKTIIFSAAMAMQASAATINIALGNGGLIFSPNITTAAVGDILEFSFYPKNHSVVMGDLTKPCQPASSGGFYSGYIPVASGKGASVFRVTVNDTKPIIMYCSQGNHCAQGMAAIINPAKQTDLKTYVDASKAAQVSAPAREFGGQLVTSGGGTGTGSGSGSGGTTTSSGPNVATGTTSSPTSTRTGAAGVFQASVGSVLAAFGMALFLA